MGMALPHSGMVVLCGTDAGVVYSVLSVYRGIINSKYWRHNTG